MAREKTVEIVDESTIADISDRHHVTLMQDHMLDYPDLYLRAFVVGDEMEQRRFAELFSRAYCKKASSVEDADFVVFTGGEDVDPQLYGGGPKHPQTSFNTKRDAEDIFYYLKCLTLGIPMVGVCRGAQFLHVMNMGKLYQHVENHYGDHELYDTTSKEMIQKVSSVHHQAVIPQKGMQVVAIAYGAHCQERWLNAAEKASPKVADIEAFFYPETVCFGVQGHPEYKGYNYYARWFLKKIEDFIVMNEDVDWVEKRRRLKPELLAQREERIATICAAMQPVKETK